MGTYQITAACCILDWEMMTRASNPRQPVERRIGDAKYEISELRETEEEVPDAIDWKKRPTCVGGGCDG